MPVDWAKFAQETLNIGGIKFVEVVDITASSGGLNAQMIRLNITTDNKDTMTHSVVVKRTREGNIQDSHALGTTREVFFFNHFAPIVDPLNHFTPKIYYAALEDDGSKTVVMEDLLQQHGVQAGYFFEANSCLNWGKDLAALTKDFPGVDAKAVTIKAFASAARLHGRFMLDTTLLSKEYLRAADWVRGEGKEGFMTIANYSINGWSKVIAKHGTTGEHGVRIDERIVRLMNNCINKLDFDNYVAMWRKPDALDDETKKIWTMVHGDFHPANFMVVDPQHGDTDFSLVLLDWEACGVGCGPQDLGQFVISHSTQATWRAVEGEALAMYRATLLEVLASTRGPEVAERLCPSLESIRSDYIEGGLCRWAWLLPVCMEVCPPAASQYFHDQMLNFMVDHNVEPESVGMMRP